MPRHVLVLGVGLSGAAVARFLAEERDAGADVSVAVIDEDVTDETRARADALRDLDVPVTLGSSEVDGAYDLVVASPGIPPSSALMRSARATGAEVVSEVEFAFRRTGAPFVAVTGTNGKTTTTALVAHLLSGAGMSAVAVGNIGTPVTGALRDLGPSPVLVAEVSSFQLALTERFHPRVAVLLNITPDHVNWHGSLEAYAADKARVFANMGAADTAVIDVDDEGSARYADPVEASGVRVVRVSRTRLEPDGAALSGGMLVVDGPGGPVELVGEADLLIKGDHNVSNALAGAAAALAMGAPADAVRQGLRTFEPIEHRLEPVGVVAGVEYCNDSKATNPDAVFKALTAFGDRPLIVMLGGRNKGSDLGPLATAVAGRCKAAVLFGEARTELAEAFARTGCRTLEAAGMTDALEAAARSAVDGDVVLLSPACASFDEFRSYEHRGDTFRELVARRAERSAGVER